MGLGVNVGMVIPAGFIEPIVLDHQAFRHPTGQGADGGFDLSWDRGKPCGGAKFKSVKCQCGISLGLAAKKVTDEPVLAACP